VLFKIDQARIAATKISLLGSVVNNNYLKFSFEKMRYNPTQNEKLLATELSSSYEILNRLKKLNQLEAFYYWSLISQME
jgi:hypothetical protein